MTQQPELYRPYRILSESSIIQSLKETSLTFSDMMRACGLNPNYDTGPFYYRLSIPLDSGIIKKEGNEYQLTSFGVTTANFVESLQRESSFLLKTEKPKTVGERKMGKIEVRWLSQHDIQDGEYGIIARYLKPPPKPEEESPSHKEFNNWQESLPLLDVPPPSFFGHVLGFESNGIKIGSIHVRFFVRQINQVATAQILAIYSLKEWLKGAGCRRVVMESSGIYWVSLYLALEDAEFAVSLANPGQVKAIPGRKTDQSDSEWLAQLLRSGLIKPSYVPEKRLRELRELTRLRIKMVNTRTAFRNRCHKVLNCVNIRLGSRLSDIFGKAGLEILEGLMEGKTIDQIVEHTENRWLRKRGDEIKEWTITGSYAGTYETWLESMALIASGRVKVDPLLTHKLRLDQILDGYNMILEKRDRAIKYSYPPESKYKR